jgi:hypothetical protein
MSSTFPGSFASRIAASRTRARLASVSLAHNASIRVFADGENRSRLVWIADLLPNDLADVVGGVTEQSQSNPLLDCARRVVGIRIPNVAIERAVSLRSAIALNGYAFVHGGDLHALLTRAGALFDWPAFAASWNDLEIDRYMADGGRYRRRRHAVYEATAGGAIIRAPHQPHYQSRDYNALNGGIARWFEPVDAAIGLGETMNMILAFSRTLFESLAGPREWRVEVHQFRIEARREERGQPTPEGIHRDGVDYVLVLLIDRRNIGSGTTTVYRLNGDELGSFTLAVPLDAALLDDSRVAHGVTPIEPLDVDRPAYRDVLVVTWQQKTAAP